MRGEYGSQVGDVGVDIVVWVWVGACMWGTWMWGGRNTGARVKRKGLTFTAAKGDCVHRSLYLKINL